MGALTRYCKSTPDKKLIVSCDAQALAQAKQILADNHLLEEHTLSLWLLSDIASLIEQHAALVIVFELNLTAALATSKRLKAYKDLGGIVVFGNARDIFFTPVQSAPQGISYAGMFQLCQGYLRGQKYLDSSKLAYAEFGLFDGRTFSLAWHTLNSVVEGYYAFDSFQGILDKAPGEELFYQTGDYYSNQNTFEFNMAMVGMDTKRLTVKPCDFDQELTRESAQQTFSHQLAVVHIDCDVYPAAYNVLVYVAPHLADGAILLFDDYDSMWGDDSLGEKRALKEWTEKNPQFKVSEYRQYSATGRAFLCRRVK